MTNLIDLVNPMAAFAVQAGLNNLWEGVALAALVGLALRTVPRANAATRYAVWSAALLAILGLPVLTAWSTVRSAANVATGTGAATSPAAAAGLPVSIPESWAVGLFGAWLIVAAALLARVAFSYGAVRRLRRACRPLDERYQERLAECLAAYHDSRPVELCASAETAVPVALGLLRPIIVLPEGLAEQLTEAELDKVLLHELAHIRRGDAWTNLFQRLAAAVAFFNPAVWYIGRQLQLEREIACDDWVVSLTGEARPYAACLTKLIELRRLRSNPQAALGAVSRMRQITRRIELLVYRRRQFAPGSSRWGIAGASGVLGLAVAVLASLPPAIAVTERTPLQAEPVEASIRPVAWRPAVPAQALEPVRQAAVEPARRRAKRIVPAVQVANAKGPADAGAKDLNARRIPLQPVSIFMDVRVERSSGYVLIQRYERISAPPNKSIEGNWILILIPGYRPASGGHGMKHA